MCLFWSFSSYSQFCQDFTAIRSFLEFSLDVEFSSLLVSVGLGGSSWIRWESLHQVGVLNIVVQVLLAIYISHMFSLFLCVLLLFLVILRYIVAHIAPQGPSVVTIVTLSQLYITFFRLWHHHHLLTIFVSVSVYEA